MNDVILGTAASAGINLYVLDELNISLLD